MKTHGHANFRYFVSVMLIFIMILRFFCLDLFSVQMDLIKEHLNYITKNCVIPNVIKSF